MNFRSDFCCIVLFLIAPLLLACSLVDKDVPVKHSNHISTQEEIWLDSLCSRTFAGRRVGTIGNKKAYLYLVAEIEKMGYIPHTQEFIHSSGDTLHNIIVDIPGQNDSVIVVGAHFDGQNESIDGDHYPAANDNASGVVALMSMLRSFKGNDYSVCFCLWDGEEAAVSPAFKGSRYYVNHYEGGQIVLYINIDSIGHNHNDAMYLGYWGGNSSDKVNVVVNTIKSYSQFNWTIISRDKPEGQSDYVSFSQKGIPNISFSDPFGTCENAMHSTKDVPNAIGMQRLYDVASICLTVMNSF